MNRDVWRDDIVVDCIGVSMLFWHQNNESEEARSFCDRYSVSTFPYICIIDPRTQAVVLRIKLSDKDVQNKSDLSNFRETFQTRLIDFLGDKPSPYHINYRFD